MPLFIKTLVALEFLADRLTPNRHTISCILTFCIISAAILAFYLRFWNPRSAPRRISDWLTNAWLRWEGANTSTLALRPLSLLAMVYEKLYPRTLSLPRFAWRVSVVNSSLLAVLLFANGLWSHNSWSMKLPPWDLYQLSVILAGKASSEMSHLYAQDTTAPGHEPASRANARPSAWLTNADTMAFLAARPDVSNMVYFPIAPQSATNSARIAASTNASLHAVMSDANNPLVAALKTSHNRLKALSTSNTRAHRSLYTLEFILFLIVITSASSTIAGLCTRAILRDLALLRNAWILTALTLFYCSVGYVLLTVELVALLLLSFPVIPYAICSFLPLLALLAFLYRKVALCLLVLLGPIISIPLWATAPPWAKIAVFVTLLPWVYASLCLGLSLVTWVFRKPLHKWSSAVLLRCADLNEKSYAGFAGAVAAIAQACKLLTG